MAAPLDDGLVMVLADVSARGHLEAQLSHDQLHDRLTGLPNRALLLDRLDHALRRRQRTNDSVVLFSVDVDRLRAVNETLGHEVGDQVLRVVACRLRHHARPSDTVGRLGGDHFLVVCEGLDEHAAEALARRLLGAVVVPFGVGTHELSVSVSIGIAVASDRDPDTDHLLVAADDALRQAKALGTGHHEFFDEPLQASARARTELGEELRRALDLRQFTLLYQPIVRLEDRRVTGFEALVRWQHPRLGLVSPADFIPLAEETGFIVPLGRWVLEEACRQRSRWARALGADGEVTMAVNLSARQLAATDIVALVESTLAATGVPPQSLCLEVTETSLLDVSTAPETLAALAATGVRIALDDFGTGYSSIGHLRRFPVHIIKIDRSFVADLDEPGTGPPIVAALTGLADTLGLEVIAEGVENQAQLRAVRQLGIDRAQGYLFAHPLRPESAAELLERGSSAERALEAQLVTEARSGPTGGQSGLPPGATSSISAGTTNAQLAQRFAAQRLIVDNYHDGALIVFDTDLRYVIAGGVGAAVDGSSTKRLEGRTVREALAPELAAVLEPHYRAALRGESATFDVSHGGRTTEIRVGPVRDPGTNEVIAGLVCSRDATAKRQSANALAEAQARFRTAFEHAPIGMAVVGMDGRYQRVNQALCDLTGYTASELCERTYTDLTHPEDHVVNTDAFRRLLDGEIGSNLIEKRYIHADGHLVWVLLTASVVRSQAGEPLYFISQIQDITERKGQEEVLRWQAERDGLTGLWNRHRFDQELARCQGLAGRRGQPASVILLDLDHFKEINDTLGHGAGDEVLRRVAGVLNAGVRTQDMAARYGGDEFAVVLPDTTTEVAGPLADRLLESIATERIFIDGCLVKISATAGVADTASGEDLIAVADRALYDAKRARGPLTRSAPDPFADARPPRPDGMTASAVGHAPAFRP